MKNKSVSKNLGNTTTGSIGKANNAAYSVKDGSNNKMSHGSRPSHINSPMKKAPSAGKPRL